MTLTWWDHAATLFEPRQDPEAQWRTPGDLAVALDPKTIQTPALDLIDAALLDVAEGRCDRLMINLSPQEGKSQRTSRRFPLWLLTRNPDLRIAIVSYAHGIARRWGRAIRDDIRDNPQVGLTVDPGSSAQHEWNVLGHAGSVYCVGITGSLTSRPVDVLIIDDPYKDAGQADSAAWQETVQEFWNEVAIPRLAPRAPVVIIQTRWRENDLSGWLKSGPNGESWRVVNIPAQCEDPDTDPLGRAVGEYMISARGRTTADWEQKKREVGSRSWNALYQGRPSPEAGDLFRREHWGTYDQPLWVERDDGARVVPGVDGQHAEVIASWDLTFTDGKHSDFVVGQVWLRRGMDCYLLDQVRGRWDFPATVAQFQALAARWPDAVLKLVEAKANGPALIAALRHSVPGIVPEEPQGSKYARASAVTPLVEAGNVHLPAPGIAPWVGEFLEETAAFPNGAHDDQVDAATQALNRLVLQPLLAGHDLVVEAEDLLEDVDTGYLAGW